MFGTEPVEIRVRAVGDWGKSSFVTLIATVEGSHYIYLKYHISCITVNIIMNI